MRVFWRRIRRRHIRGMGHCAAILCLVVFHSLPVEAKTRSDFDPEARFADLKTFAFVAGVDLGKSGLMDDPETRTRIANFVSGMNLLLRRSSPKCLDPQYR